jgi:E3 ubiquitin-protein ligase RNF5
MAADDAAQRSRRMDLNLYLGLPRAPRARRPDLGSDLALGTPMLSSSSPSSSAASAEAPPLEVDPVHPPYSPSRADLVRPPTPAHEPYYPSAPQAHPPLPTLEAAPMLADEPDFGLSHAHLGLIGRMDRPSSSTASSSVRPEPAERPRRLICLTGRQSRYFRPTRRFRSDLPPVSSEALSMEDDAGAQPLESEEPVPDTVEENKVVAAVGVSEDEEAERGKSAAVFECNICFEMAAEPVVTSCGHLFCWPCLYQWLHVHSSHKECPVCKEEVNSGNITPIYGRGNSSSDNEKKVAEDGNASGPKIPPRPHGNRLESFRQQFHHLRPISRRLDAQGILSTWRRILDQHLMNSISGPETPESIAQDNRFSRMTTRLRARRLLREVENPTIVASSALEGGPPMSMSNTFDPLPRHTSSSLSSEGIDLLRQIAISGIDDSERLATALGDLRRIARPSQFGASTSSNPPNTEPVSGTNVAMPLAADQASNSSTMAVIQEDAAFTESAGEPSNDGPSRSLRRRRINTLASLDVDGGDLHRNKRRRLN